MFPARAADQGPLDCVGIDALRIVHFVKHVGLNACPGKSNTKFFQRLIVRVSARHNYKQHFVWLPIEHTLVETLLRTRGRQATTGKLFEFYSWVFAPEDVDNDGNKTRGRGPVQSHRERVTDNGDLLRRQRAQTRSENSSHPAR